jgi:ATP-binding cassette subfamily F protein uup
LVLDEPTNDLDIETLNVLEEFLEEYGGCIMVVTHDRYFMDTIVDSLFVFEGEGNIRPFNGNYQEYLNEQEDIQAALYAAKSTTPKGEYKVQETKIEIAAPVKRKLTFNEQRLFEQLEKELAQHHAKKLELENK